MGLFKSLLYASTLLSVIVFALPQPDSESLVATPASLQDRATPIKPQCWSGTAFPPEDRWVSYDKLFVIAEGAMRYGNDTTGEIEAINKSILAIAHGTGFDPRFILAIMRRESDGRTTIPCGDNGKSCGLMQVQGHDVGHCTHHPCPSPLIRHMIQCGVTGCQGPSLRDCRLRYSRYGAIARCYNSGSVPDPYDWTQDGGAGIRTYVMDVANLLLGSDYAEWSSFDHGECGYTDSS